MTVLVAHRAQYDALLERVRELAGLRFPEDRRPDMELATRRAMLKAGVASLEEYAARVAAGNVSLAGLVEEVTIGETYFFREPEQFAFLRDVVLPEVVSRRQQGLLRLWSAGCASGEEAYSLAILSHELGLAQRTSVVATDISRRALGDARLGRYRAWSLRGTSVDRVRPHLVEPPSAVDLSDPAREAASLQLGVALRSRVRFAELNLVEASYPSPANGIRDFDVVLCRNVLIYFDRPTVERVARRLYDSLAEGGWLIAASSDPPLSQLAPFVAVVTESGVFYRKLERPSTMSSAVARGGRASAVDAPENGAEYLPPASPVAPAVGVRHEPPSLSGIAVVPPPVADRATRIRELANRGDLIGAARVAEERFTREPLGATGSFVYASVLRELSRDREAARALEQALYLEGNFVAAHLALGMVRCKLDDQPGARRSFQTVLRLCAPLDRAAIIPFSDGACAGHVARVAAAELERLGPGGSTSRG